eukprot:scaffold403813_cov59-Attheya_sp.AAC.5
MSNSPLADMVYTVPSIVQGTPTHTAHDPNVAVHTPLGTVVDQYRPSKPTRWSLANNRRWRLHSGKRRLI